MNSGPTQVRIQQFRTTCGCTTVTAHVPLTIEPESALHFEVAIRTLGQHGEFVEQVEGLNEDGNTVFHLQLKGKAEQLADFKPKVIVLDPAVADKTGKCTADLQIRCGPQPLTKLGIWAEPPLTDHLTAQMPHSLAPAEQAKIIISCSGIPLCVEGPIRVTFLEHGYPIGHVLLSYRTDSHFKAIPGSALLANGTASIDLKLTGTKTSDLNFRETTGNIKVSMVPTGEFLCRLNLTSIPQNSSSQTQQFAILEISSPTFCARLLPIIYGESFR